MTRKDYELLAAALLSAKPDAQAWSPDGYGQWRHDVATIAYALAAANPRFDGIKFLNACGV